MSEQPENKPVVGEDGELLQADKAVDPEAYAEFVATYVHRDPPLFVLREHIRENGCAYLMFSPIIIGVPILIMGAVFFTFRKLLSGFDPGVIGLVIGSVVLILIIGVGYLVIEARNYYR